MFQVDRSNDQKAVATHDESDGYALLRKAMDVDCIRGALRENRLQSSGLSADICEVDLIRVFPKSSGKFVLEYCLAWNEPGGVKRQHYLAELWGETASHRCQEVIGRLRKERRGQLENDDCDSVFCLPSMGLVFRKPGLDERIPGLRFLYDHELSVRVLGRYLQGEVPDFVETQLLAHRLGKRCVVRFIAHSKGRKISFIGKMYKERTSRANETYKATEVLRQRFASQSEYGIPRNLGFFPEWQMILLEDLGNDVLRYPVSPRQAFESTGRLLAQLHAVDFSPTDTYSEQDELNLINSRVSLTLQLVSQLGDPLGSVLAHTQGDLKQLAETKTAPSLVHRDFYDKQVLSRGSRYFLIDFDTLCSSDPAMDVGNFLAHLRLRELQSGVGETTSTWSFLNGYGPVDADFRWRIAAYQRSALLRLACLYAVRPRWAHVCPLLLESAREC